MWATVREKRKLLGYALLVVGVWGLIFAWHFAAPGETAPPDSFAADQSQGVEPSPRDEPESLEVRARTGLSSSGMDQPGTATFSAGDAPAAQSASLLQEAELDHLNEVFLNTLHPLFQHDFPLDLEGRAAIDAFVASMPEGLTSEDLDTISAMIEDRLATPEAEDLAFIITHLYRLEQEEARLMSEGGPVTTMADQLAAQERLSQLRDDWFGPELSEVLFSGVDDAGASRVQSPAESMAGSSDTGQPPKALTEEQAELAGIESAWQQRYHNFLAEKRVIERAGLDQSEKDRQIEELLQRHYTPQEVEAARAFDQEISSSQ